MIKSIACVAVVSLVFWQSGCGDGTLKQPATPPSANISISPGSATVGSPDLTLTVTGSQNFTFPNEGHKFTQVVWSGSVRLATTFISSTQLTAIVPASLLASPFSTTVHVEIWDRQGDAPIATSSSVPFQVTSTPTPNISISPDSATVGSPDLTLTILALNNFTFHDGIWHSRVLWRQDGVDTELQANVVNSSELTAILPAALLVNPITAKVRVEIWDNVEGTVVATSSSVPFSVTSP